MEPTYKTPGMNETLRKLGIDREDIKHNICTWCEEKAVVFKNALSEKEYSISGLCQSCQDKTFGGGK